MKIIAIAAMTAVAGMTAPAKRNVTVYVNQDLNNDRSMVLMYQARERAGKMFAEAGVRIDWRTGRPSGAQPARGPEIVVSFMQLPLTITDPEGWLTPTFTRATSPYSGTA